MIESIIVLEKDVPITNEASTVHQLLRFFGDANATNLPNNLSCIWLYEHIRDDMTEVVKNIRKICKLSHKYLTDYLKTDLSKSLLFLKYTKLARTSCIFYGIRENFAPTMIKMIKKPVPLFTLPSIDRRLDTFTSLPHADQCERGF